MTINLMRGCDRISGDTFMPLKMSRGRQLTQISIEKTTSGSFYGVKCHMREA